MPDVDPVFTALEQAVVAHAVQDWAGSYHRTVGDPVRYVVEGHLDALVRVHGTRVVWDAVAEVVRAAPSVLDLPVAGPDGREARQAARVELASELLADARTAFDAGDHERALRLVDEAQLVEPAHQPARGVTFERVREVITEAAEQ